MADDDDIDGEGYNVVDVMVQGRHRRSWRWYEC